jgi:hypothetical protein
MGDDGRCLSLFPPPILFGFFALGYFSVFAIFPFVCSMLRPPPVASYCNFNFTSRAVGSPSDALFLYSSSFVPGLELALRSFRSTCVLCRVVVFGDSNFAANERQSLLFQSLRVELITTCVDAKNRSSAPHMLRYECIASYLDAHADVRRVFHSDAHDVFFQGNPFASLSSAHLSFVVEPHCIRTCGWNLNWLMRCYGRRVMGGMTNRFIVCSGSIGGPAAEFRKLIALMVAQPEWTTCWAHSFDQPILNQLLWSGEVARAGIKYELGGCDAGVYTMQWCVIEREVLMNEDSVVVSRVGTKPFLLHQYNRIENFDAHLFERCFVRTNEQ